MKWSSRTSASSTCSLGNVRECAGYDSKMSKVKVEISRERKIEIFGIAKKRVGPASRSRKRSKKWRDDELDYLGIIGEEAARVVTGGEVNWEIGGDEGIDLILPDGRVAAVKYRHEKAGYCLVEKREGDTKEVLWDLRAAEVLIHTVGRCGFRTDCSCRSETFNEKTGMEAWVTGWLPVSEFMEKKRSSNWGVGWRYWVEQRDLRPIEELIGGFHDQTIEVPDKDRLRWERVGRCVECLGYLEAKQPGGLEARHEGTHWPYGLCG
jgi:hypothetical protein